MAVAGRVAEEALAGGAGLTASSDGGLEAELSSLLSADEITATKIRVETLLKHRVHPFPPVDWPAVPWPPV